MLPSFLLKDDMFEVPFIFIKYLICIPCKKYGQINDLNFLYK